MPTRPLHPPPTTTHARFPWHGLGDRKGASAHERRASFAGASTLLLSLLASLVALGCSSSVSSSSGGTGGSSTTTSSSTSAGGAGGDSTSSSSSSSSAASSGGTGGAACVPVDDSNPCTDDVCISGVPTSTPKAAGSFCAVGGQCDAMGTCVTSACSATLGFPTIPTVSLSQYATSMTTADLDGDGKLDLITANDTGTTVSVLRSLGNGTFAPEVTYAAGMNPSSIVALDLNADGKPDLAIANKTSSGTVSVLLNLGNGTFAPAVSYAAGGYTASVAAADVDGDGKPDLVTANSNGFDDSDDASVLLNQGNGTFAVAVNYAVGVSPTSVAIADLNGDGKLDLAIVLFDGLLFYQQAVLLNLGNGTFAAPVKYSTHDYANIIKAEDLNGDGKPDLVTTDANTQATYGTLSVRLNLGDGTFGPSVHYEAAARPRDMTTADLDGDGDLDIIITSLKSQSIEGDRLLILVNQGNGTFTPAARASYVVGLSPYALTAADLDGDGKPDLAVATSDKVVRVLVNLGDGTFAVPRIYAEGSPGTSVAAADFDGDGKLDLATSKDYSNKIRVLFNQGNGTFTPGADFVATTPGSFILAAADLDGDGKPDIVTGSRNSGAVSALLNLGNGTFAAPTTYDVSAGTSSMEVMDLNGDGKPDIVVATGDNNNNNVSVLLNLGNGTFAPAVNYAPGMSYIKLITADLNGDSKPDFIITRQDIYNVSVLLNQGNGTFAPAVNYVTNAPASSMTVADLDGDGKPDLLVPSSGSVLLNLGNGTFAAPVNYPVLKAATSVTATDLDGDGKIDLVLIGSGGGTDTVSVVFNQGNGTFTAPIKYAVGYQPTVRVTDLNGDNMPDLLIATLQNGIVSLRINQGNRTFAALDYEVSSVGSSDLLALELNGDGHPDLVAVSGPFEGSAALSVFLTRCTP
jgi:FG-GAP-like repeat